MAMAGLFRAVSAFVIFNCSGFAPASAVALAHGELSIAKNVSEQQLQLQRQQQYQQPQHHQLRVMGANIADPEEHGGESEDDAFAEQKEIVEAHEAPTPVSDAVALMLLGMVAFQISLFYLVNFPDKDIQQFTWMSLSQTISIFCSLNIWHAIKSTVEFFSNEHEGEMGTGAGMTTELTLMMLFVTLFTATQIVMANMWKRTTSLKAFGTISAHTLGFSAVDTFGEIVQDHPWRDNWYAVAVGATITSLVLIVFVHFTTRLRKQWSEGIAHHCEEEHAFEHYMEVCSECENEFVGFVLGLLFTQAMIYVITGQMPPIEGYPFQKSRQDVVSLGLGSLGTMATLVAFILGVRKVYKDEQSSPAMARAIEVIEMTLSMTVGWSLLYCGRWSFWVSTNDHGVGQGDIMSARIVQALCFSFFVFVNIFVLDYFADSERGILDASALRALMSALGLLLGLSWEGAFSEALESLGREFADQPKMHLLLMNGMGAALCTIVLPGWAMYILPSAMGEGGHHHEGSLEAGKASKQAFETKAIVS